MLQHLQQPAPGGLGGAQPGGAADDGERSIAARAGSTQGEEQPYSEGNLYLMQQRQNVSNIKTLGI